MKRAIGLSMIGLSLLLLPLSGYLAWHAVETGSHQEGRIAFVGAIGCIAAIYYGREIVR